MTKEQAIEHYKEQAKAITAACPELEVRFTNKDPLYPCEEFIEFSVIISNRKQREEVSQGLREISWGFRVDVTKEALRYNRLPVLADLIKEHVVN